MDVNKTFWILFAVAGVTYGYRSFQSRIPNGNNVTHPCDPDVKWGAVGHMEPRHVMAKNPFGNSWKANGFVWNPTFCEQDADGDGETNGAELGDPNCRWSLDNKIPLQPPIGHPGICESDRRMCTSGVSYRSCPHRGGRGGGRPSFNTPPPHAGKHPQALLTERLGTGTGGFGNMGGGFDGGFQQPPIGGGFRQPQTFSPAQQQPRFDGPDFSRSLSPSTSFTGMSGGQGDMFGPVQGQPPMGSFGIDQSQMSGSFAGPDRSGSSSGFWQSGPGSPAGGFEPTRDSLSRTLNQQFLQGGSHGGPGSFSGGFQQSPSGQSSLERQVQRRIDRARAGMPSGPFTQWGRSSAPSAGMGQTVFVPPYFRDARSMSPMGGRATMGVGGPGRFRGF